MNNHKSTIRAFLGGFVRVAELGDDDDMFATAFVNSLFAMQLILWIEKEFGVVVKNEDLRMSNFKSISAIDAFISSKFAVEEAGQEAECRP
jgi:acyl carrier protein